MHRFIIVAGSSYSGSTLLAMLLGRHPRIATVGEMTGPEPHIDENTYHCSCGSLLRDCDFWRAVARQMTSNGTTLNLRNFGTRYRPLKDNPLQRMQFSNLRTNRLENLRDFACGLSPDCRAYRDAITRRNIALANAILDVTGKDVFLDTSKNPTRVKPLSEALQDRLFAIQLTRDGRDVMLSRRKYHGHIPLARAIQKWKRVNQRAQRVLEYVDPRRRYALRYEDLASNPVETLTRLCASIGIAYDPACLEVSPQSQHILGNTSARLGGRRQVEKPVSGKAGLSAEDSTTFDRIAGALNRSYGYE